MKTITSIEQLIDALENGEYYYYGLRKASDADLEVIESGETELNRSHNWDEFGMSDDLLPGTCAIYVDRDMNADEIARRYDHVAHTYDGDTILLIADDNSSWGDDDNEIILGTERYGADAVAIVKIAR